MAMVYLYTIYTDLLTNITQETLKIQRSRDIVIHNEMIEKEYPNFPMHENDVGHLFSFFKEITRKNPLLNILLRYRLNKNDSSAIIVRNNEINIYSTFQEAVDSITMILGGNYKFIISPVIR